MEGLTDGEVVRNDDHVFVKPSSKSLYWTIKTLMSRVTKADIRRFMIIAVERQHAMPTVSTDCVQR